MGAAKRRRLERAGWRVGTVQEFLGLTDAEMAFIEVKLRLTTRLKERRRQVRLTQGALAKRIESGQSPDGKMEAIIQNYNVFVRPVGGNATSGFMLSTDGSQGNAYPFQNLTRPFPGVFLPRFFQWSAVV